ncbi:serine hydrolase [Secundilactobacillus silagei]|uniref:D-alanyl-D-alanine carboxypeptidase n=1 Tax=Secundilactobacillus silagei JCM 19001 TaxID=1302250 RepID=A0A1Z5IHH8_9LACO|nr:serine hydrolase [Secundilactobacillus silagei]TDG69279.1 hypothetical protein C5L25_000210 [Secundilactobacillus silagei JCM 19001]GAX01002.1 D-alanyl-D-alanine carboxypeptidase [Secundilactobacillus silagei JCM 19001]
MTSTTDHRFTRIVLITIAALLSLFSLMALKPAAASAASYSVVSSSNMAKTAYHRSSSKGAVYNISHTRKISNLSSHPNTTWYATKKVTLKHGATKAVYYAVKNGAGNISGYVWHSYLSKGQAPVYLKYAKSAVAMNAKTDKVLYSKNANTPRPIASISKLMTLYLVEQKVANTGSTWDSKVTTSYSGLKRMGASSTYGGFKFNHNTYTVKQLYQAALIESSNNAAIALGQWVAGGSTPSANHHFIGMMNAQAKKWNLGHASFVSANGMEQSALRGYGYSVSGRDANMVSAKDVALIAKHLITDYPAVLSDSSRGSMRVDGQLLYNYNNLLPGRRYYDSSLKVDGLKTGFTNLAGYCFVGTGQKSGHDRLITVVLHDEDEFTETRSLMQYVYARNLI